MAITKAMVEKHGGLIDFTTVIGVGSTFYIKLKESSDDMQEGEVPLLLEGIAEKKIY